MPNAAIRVVLFVTIVFSVAVLSNCRSLSRVIHIGRPPFNKDVPCDISCKAGHLSSGVVRRVELPDINAHITLSMEGEKYYSALRLASTTDRNNARAFIGSTRLDSDVPMPYYYWSWTRFLENPPKDTSDIWSKNWIQTTPPKFEDAAPRALFLASNCAPRNKRNSVVKRLEELGVPIDSAGACLKNIEIPRELNANKAALMRKYRVYLAFENQNVDDYITEKLWVSLSSGVIPVYYGAPNARYRLPAGSSIILKDFKSISSAADEIKRVIYSEEAYNEYHAWRFRPLEKSFVRMWNFTHVHSECRLCRFVSEKLDYFEN